MTSSRKAPRRPRNLLRLEALEERTLLSASVVEDFEAGSLSAYQTALRYAPSAVLLPAAAHDGLVGLVKQDGYEWLIRDDAGTQVHEGDTVSAWTQLAGAADGRAYLGFDSQNSGAVHSPIRTGGTLAVVLAANTNQLLVEKDSGTNGVASFTTVAAVTQTYQADHWYRLEATWGAGGAITANLYDSDGTTLLNTAGGTTTAPFPAGGGIALRAFGHDKYFDSVVVDSGSTGTADERANAGGGLDPSWVPGDPPAPVGNGPAGGAAPVPWQYANTPGSGLEIQLASFNALQQVAIVNGVVGLAATNDSLNTGSVQVGWGDPLETPLLAQYIFRQLPGEQTRLLGASSVKHFFSSARADSQHLNPGEDDVYSNGLNGLQTYYTAGSELDPVTGTLHSSVDRGHLSPDGLTVNDNRTFTNRIQYLLQVPVADLDPAQNPAGTRWFLMGNEFIGGEQDVAQASRWVEVAPHYSGTSFTFTYPSGATGQLNFRTIPGLTDTLNVPMTAADNNLVIRNDPAAPANVQVVNGATSAVLAEDIIGGINRIAVSGDASADTLTLDYSFGNPLPGGGLNYQAGSGPATLVVNDQSTAAGQTFALAPDSLQRSGGPVVSYAGIADLILYGGGGGNTFNVSGTSAGTALYFDGGTGNNTATGSNSANNWLVSAANAGELFGAAYGNAVAFADVQNLRAGSGGDYFAFSDGASISGNLTGKGTGLDYLDYSAYTTSVVVDLQTGFATAVGGTLGGITALAGGSGTPAGLGVYNLLIGNGGDALYGGVGRRNLLVAGGSASYLGSGDGEDLLIGGSTVYDTQAGLADWRALAAYWAGTDPYATRADNVVNGVGVPRLDGTTVSSNGGGNYLAGNGALGLIYTDGFNAVVNFDPASRLVPI